MAEEAYVSMFIGDSSRPGSLDGLRVLLHSLRRHDARRPFVLMTVEPLRGEAAAALQRAYPLRVVQVPELRSTDAACLTTLDARLAVGFTSFNVWNLTDYRKLVWLEADQLVLRPLDALWSSLDGPRDARVSSKLPAAAAAKTLLGPYSSCERGRKSSKFNTGVLLLRPSKKRYGYFVDALRGGKEANYTCHDGFQTLWNRVMRGRVRCVERSFNCIAQRDLLAPQPSRHCLLGNASVPHVAHFAGRANKPWTAPASEGARRWREGSWAYSLWARAQIEAKKTQAQKEMRNWTGTGWATT